jgi:hypothetical protein
MARAGLCFLHAGFYLGFRRDSGGNHPGGAECGEAKVKKREDQGLNHTRAWDRQPRKSMHTWETRVSHTGLSLAAAAAAVDSTVDSTVESGESQVDLYGAVVGKKRKRGSLSSQRDSQRQRQPDQTFKMLVAGSHVCLSYLHGVYYPLVGEDFSPVAT